MSNELSIRSSVEIKNGPLEYRSYPQQFRADMTGVTGPTPGALSVNTTGVAVDLSLLEVPGICIIRNLDTEDTIVFGISDGLEFYPLGDVLPGEVFVLRLSQFLGSSFGIGPGTGTADSGTYSLFLKSLESDVIASVEAFEK